MNGGGEGLWDVRIGKSSQQLETGDRPLGWVPQSSALSSPESESVLSPAYDTSRRVRVDLLADSFAPVRWKKSSGPTRGSPVTGRNRMHEGGQEDNGRESGQ